MWGLLSLTMSDSKDSCCVSQSNPGRSANPAVDTFTKIRIVVNLSFNSGHNVLYRVINITDVQVFYTQKTLLRSRRTGEPRFGLRAGSAGCRLNDLRFFCNSVFLLAFYGVTRHSVLVTPVRRIVHYAAFWLDCKRSATIAASIPAMHFSGLSRD